MTISPFFPFSITNHFPKCSVFRCVMQYKNNLVRERSWIRDSDGNSVYKSSVIGRELTPSRIQETREMMRPENRYGQMTPSERVAFALSEEGKNYLFPWGFTVDGKRYEKMVPGRVARVFDEESRLTEQSYSREETSQIFRTAFLLFAGYVDAATSFAQNCGGGGSAPDQDWGRDKNEDDILWTRRCFRKAREMITTPVIRWGMRR